MANSYVCSICNEPVKRTGQPGNLGTMKCSKHPFRFVTVPRDTSGGSEQLRDRRKEPIQVKRHTLVKVLHSKRD